MLGGRFKDFESFIIFYEKLGFYLIFLLEIFVSKFDAIIYQFYAYFSALHFADVNFSFFVSIPYNDKEHYYL